MAEEKPIQIDASALRPVLVQIVTKLLTIFGASLAARGFISEDQLAGMVPAVAQEIVGILVALGATAWAAWRSKRNNDQKLAIVQSPQTLVPPSVAVVTDKSADLPQVAMLVPFLMIALSAGGLAGCATTTADSVRLNTYKAFYAAQVAFHASQQTVLVVCTNPQPALAQPCQKALDVLKTGAQAEAAGFTAQQAGNSTDLQTAIITLTALPSQLADLGVLEKN